MDEKNGPKALKQWTSRRQFSASKEPEWERRPAVCTINVYPMLP